VFRDRREAGATLGRALAEYRGQDVIVLALPRGGVPVGVEVARALSAPLDVFIVRKLGVPGREELAMGAIASGGSTVVDRETIRTLGIRRETLMQAATHEAAELARRERLYRAGRPPPDVRGRIVIVVDDGIATGSTMQVALTALRDQGPAKLVVAAGVGAPETCSRLRSLADDVVVPFRPTPFFAVGLWYEDFTPTTDDDVRSLLAESGASLGASAMREPR
jgi:predicted phosphoribosyltransferase